MNVTELKAEMPVYYPLLYGVFTAFVMLIVMLFAGAPTWAAVGMPILAYGVVNESNHLYAYMKSKEPKEVPHENPKP
jgi:hypothetical protein